jgi:hypothetical protein
LISVTSEDVVGRDVDEPGADFLASRGKVPDRGCVDRQSQRFTGLAVIDCCEGGAVDDRGWSGVDNPVIYGVVIADVQSVDVSPIVVEASILTDRCDGPTELTVDSGDENSAWHGVDGSRERRGRIRNEKFGMRNEEFPPAPIT